MTAATRVALTVDVEGDFGTESLRGVDEAWPWLLDRLDEVGARATFFVVSRVAARRPAALRAALARGHSLGSHTASHRALGRLTPAERRSEIADSRRQLEDLAGAPCLAFRAPFFDAPPDLGPLLEDAGYSWSSSKAPFSPVALYRHRRSCAAPHLLDGSRVREHPVPGFRGLPMPEGLSYRRLFWPLTALPAAAPSVFYLHLYDLLDKPDGFDLPRAWRPFMTARAGDWTRAHLSRLLRDWKAAGCVLEPPEPSVPHSA